MADKTWLPFPDIEAIVASGLRAAGVCGGRVYSSVPSSPVYPLATVVRLGGIPYVERKLDSARIQIAVWGDNKSQARDASEAARLACHKLEGTTSVTFAGAVTRVEDELGPTFLPDPDTTKDRYIFAVLVSAQGISPLVT